MAASFSTGGLTGRAYRDKKVVGVFVAFFVRRFTDHRGLVVWAISSWLVAFNVINTRNRVVSGILNARLTASMIRPADPPFPARFRWNRSVAAGVVAAAVGRAAIGAGAGDGHGPVDVTATLIDGKKTPRATTALKVAQGVAEFAASHARAPGLTVYCWSATDAASANANRRQGQDLPRSGHDFEHRLPADTGRSAGAQLAALNADPAIGRHPGATAVAARIDTDLVIAAIDPAKGVDGFHLRQRQQAGHRPKSAGAVRHQAAYVIQEAFRRYHRRAGTGDRPVQHR
jgi:hypothetical protein